MPGKLTYIGLILLLIGVVFLAIAETNLGNVKLVEVGLQDTVWYYATNLTSGRTYRIDIVSSDDWGKPFGDSTFTKAMPVNVTITSPTGGVTALQAYYLGLETTNPLYKLGTPPAIVDVVYQNVDDAAMRVEFPSSEIRFIAKQTGLYNVSVLQAGLWSKDPPDRIIYYEEVAPNRNAYSILAFGGGILGTVGGATSVASLFRNRGSKHKGTRK
jgi:hypothetical protein